MAIDFGSNGFRETFVILAVAGVVIPTFARFKITPVIGFLLVGLLVGPHALGAIAKELPWLSWITISNTDAIAPFGEIGIILLLFSIGLELSFKRLWSMRRRVFGLGAAELFGGALLLALALMGFGWSPSSALGLGLALALSSTALILPIAGTTSSVGRLAFPMLLFEDLAIVPIIFLLGVIGQGQGAHWADLGMAFLYGVMTVAALLIIGRFALPPLLAQAARTKSPELFMSASLLVVIISSALTAAVGLSPIVGALVAGLLIAETDYRAEVEVTIAPFRGLALGVFLISVGMNLDVVAVLNDWPMLAIAVVGVVSIKAAVTYLLLKLAKVRASIATEISILMASPSELTLIVLAAATQAGLINAKDAAFWQIVTAIGMMITPLLARIGQVSARRIEWEARAAPEDVLTIDPERTIIIGYGRVGKMVGDMLRVHAQPWVALEGNVDAVTAGRRAENDVRFGDARKHETINAMHPEHCKAVVLTMNDPVQSVRLTKSLRERFPTLTIIARARDNDHAADLYRAGANDAVPEALESSLQLSEAVLVDLGIAMGPVIASIHEKREEMRRHIQWRGAMDRLPRLKSLKPKV
jgi:monovalent cation:H+ antiporter-2, CPA2 family